MRLKLARMGIDRRIHLLREKVLTKIDGGSTPGSSPGAAMTTLS
jgi:hypothetical protein